MAHEIIYLEMVLSTKFPLLYVVVKPLPFIVKDWRDKAQIKLIH